MKHDAIPPDDGQHGAVLALRANMSQGADTDMTLRSLGRVNVRVAPLQSLPNAEREPPRLPPIERPRHADSHGAAKETKRHPHGAANPSVERVASTGMPVLRRTQEISLSSCTR